MLKFIVNLKFTLMLIFAISKHLMLKFIKDRLNAYPFLFIISKHLMLKFIDIAEILTPVFENFKTSYVEVYRAHTVIHCFIFLFQNILC